jgi:hypothetical protein
MKLLSAIKSLFRCPFTEEKAIWDLTFMERRAIIQERCVSRRWHRGYHRFWHNLDRS